LAKYQDIKEIPLEKIGFEVKKIDFASFRKNFQTLMTQEAMKDESKKIFAI